MRRLWCRAPGCACSWLNGLGAAIVVAGVLMPIRESFALWDDKLNLFIEEKITRDDNVFRLSKHVDPAVFLGGDTYRTTSLGFNLDAPVSRQRFQAGLTWNKTRYDRFTDLDLTGREARAAWLWQFGNDLAGQLGYTETFSLASFANIQSRTPDRLRVQQAFYSATFLATPRWRLQTGVNGLEQTNSDPARQANDVKILSSSFTVSYVTPAATSVGVGLRAEGGRFPNRQLLAAGFFDNAYRQYGAGIVADWTPTGHSHLAARADRVGRRYEQVPQRDFDGNTARVEYDWKPTGKLSLATVVQRDISANEDIRSSFVFVKGVTLRPALKVSEKIDVSGTLDYSVRDYLGDPGLAFGVTPSRIDRVRSATTTISYRPARSLALSMSAQRETRSSNVAFVDYAVNVISIAARITF